jgi:hypothetical protein
VGLNPASSRQCPDFTSDLILSFSFFVLFLVLPSESQPENEERE